MELQDWFSCALMENHSGPAAAGPEWWGWTREDQEAARCFSAVLLSAVVSNRHRNKLTVPALPRRKIKHFILLFFFLANYGFHAFP